MTTTIMILIMMMMLLLLVAMVIGVVVMFVLIVEILIVLEFRIDILSIDNNRFERLDLNFHRSSFVSILFVAKSNRSMFHKMISLDSFFEIEKSFRNNKDSIFDEMKFGFSSDRLKFDWIWFNLMIHLMKWSDNDNDD